MRHNRPFVFFIILYQFSRNTYLKTRKKTAHKDIYFFIKKGKYGKEGGVLRTKSLEMNNGWALSVTYQGTIYSGIKYNTND